MREIKLRFVFKHPKGEILISKPYTIDEILETDIIEIQENCCTCSCQPVGETNVVECNCCEYYDEFELISKLQYTGLKDKNGVDIYEGDILSFETKRSNGFQEDGRMVILPPVEFGEFCVRNDTLYVFTGFHIDGNSIEYKLYNGAAIIGNIHQTPELLK